MLEKEARTNKAGADLDKRNRNWQKIDDIFTRFIKLDLVTAAQATIPNNGFYTLNISYTVPTGYKVIGYTVGFNSAVQCGGFYRPHNGNFACYYHNVSGAERTGMPFVNVTLAKTNYVDGDLLY